MSFNRSTYLFQVLGISGEELNTMLGIVSWATCGDGRSRERRKQAQDNVDGDSLQKDIASEVKTDRDISIDGEETSDSKDHSKDQESGPKQVLTQEFREQVGRKAKALLDWGRVLYLREKGFDARLCYYVPSSVSLENVCIVAKKVSVM